MDLIEHANSKRRMVALVTAFAAVAAGIVFSLMIILEMVLPTVSPTRNSDGNPLLRRRIWSVRPPRAK